MKSEEEGARSIVGCVYCTLRGEFPAIAGVKWREEDVWMWFEDVRNTTHEANNGDWRANGIIG